MRNTPPSRQRLAIIIPYYKIVFFEHLLRALADQTNKNFRVYIGDDCSPHPPDSLIEKYKTLLNIEYVRFSDQLGQISLVKQWNRCLAMASVEEWIWFLPDDDVPSRNCVEAFYDSLEMAENRHVKVIRLALEVIDHNGATLKAPMASPAFETNSEYYSRLICGKTISSLGDNIFNAQALRDSGGFIEFPKAWGSDHATILNVSAGGVLHYLKDAKLGFRMSGHNISSDTSDGLKKIAARHEFAKWIKANHQIFDKPPDAEFYRAFFRKGEHYLVNEWPFNLKIWINAYLLSVTCHQSYNPVPIIKLLLMKILATSTRFN